MKVLRGRLIIGAVFCREKCGLQCRESVPVFLEGVQFICRNAAEHRGVDIPVLRFFGGIDVTRNVEVVVVIADFLTGYHLREVFNRLTGRYRIHNLLDIAGPKLIALPFFLKSLRGINDQHVVISPILSQNHDDCRNAGAKENIGRKPNDRIDVVLVDQILSDRALFTAAEQHAVRENNRHDAVRLQVIEIVKEEGVVRLALRRQPV